MNTRLANALALTVMLCSVTATAEYVRRGYSQSPAPPTHNARYVRSTRAPTYPAFRDGESQAPVVITEFADFQCPGCRSLQPVLDSFVTKSGGKLAVLHRHFPLTGIHPFARLAAIAAECAGRQGRYAAYQRVLYAAQDSIGSIAFATLASRANVPDSAAFVRCETDPAVRSRIDDDIAEASRLDLAGTPSLVIGDSVYMGLSAQALDSTIRNFARSRGIEWP